jgi:hypothetical protein
MHRGLVDKKRRNFILPTSQVESTIPEYFLEDYPQLVTLLKKYFDWMDNNEQSPAEILPHLLEAKDVVSTDNDLLSFIEDEQLLGQSYFEGFPDKRSAAQFAHILYKSKGTRYSIQQFFRMFYNTDPDIIYPKQYIFKLNTEDSLIGPSSQRYLQNDKLYQTYAILIKIGFSSSDWRDLYKLFVHPAGFYLGAEVQIVSSIDLDYDNMPDIIEEDLPPIAVEGVGTFSTYTETEMTGTLRYAEDGTIYRVQVPLEPLRQEVDAYDGIATTGELATQYSSIIELIQRTSPQFDEDHDADSSGIDFTNTIETMDQVQRYWWDSDSDGYVQQIILRDDSAE